MYVIISIMKLVMPGASGFLGANLLDHILADDNILNRYDELILVDVLQYGEQKISSAVLNHPKVTFIKDSIYNPDVLNKVIDANDVVVHLAVEENTYNNPQDSSTANIEEYVHAIADKKVNKFIFISSADIYGINNSDNILESDELKPTIIYAANKMSFEGYIQAYYSLANLPAIIFRPVTIYGPNQYPGWLVPRVITRAINNEKIQITGDGSVKRDWIHVDDVCGALLKALESTNKKVFGQAFNLGTGYEMSVIDVTKHILDKTNRSEALIEFTPYRSGDIPRQITSAQKAKEYFDWSSMISLNDGLDSTIDWYKNNN